MLQSTTPVLLRTTKYYSSTTPYYKVLLQYNKVLLQYYSVLQSTTPVLLRTTKYYSSTTPYYKVLLRTTKYYSSTTPYYKVPLQYYKVLVQYYSVLAPKRSFRARLPRNFTEQASKKIVSCEASSKFHRTSFQKDRFVRGFLEISQNKLPKRSFRARLPRNFTEQASKKIVSCEASSKFHRTILLKRTFRAMLPTISTENLRFATVSCNRPTESYERVHPAKAKCASRYNGVPSKISKCAFRYSGVRKNVWIQRTTSEATRGIQKSPFYHSFGHLTSTKWREGCAVEVKICVSPQFWTSDEHETTRGLRGYKGRFAFHHSFGRPTSTKWREGCDGDLQNSHFTTVLDVRRARSDERVARAMFKICISPQFWTSDEHEVTRGWSPVLVNQTHPA